MLIFNNLIINNNSKKYQPFLFNLITGRRYLLSDYEFSLVNNMKKNKIYFNEEEIYLYNKLIYKKQFITDEKRKQIEKNLIESKYFSKNDIYSENYSFSIELTRECNMSCSFCYADSRKNKSLKMTKDKIDAIYKFYIKYCDDKKKIENTPYIRITGGEPLYDMHTVNMINYISLKWNKTKLILFTNGLNITKYLHKLPINRFKEVHVSLDGVEETHLRRRFSKKLPEEKSYEKIILGIKKLIDRKINVILKTTLDKDNYECMSDFLEYLNENGILNSEYCELETGITLDYHNELDIMNRSNNIEEITKIKNSLDDLNIHVSTYPSLSVLYNMITRTKNEPCLPKCNRCRNKFLDNYYFACDGNVYHCDCIEDYKGVVGTFFPTLSVDYIEVNKNLNRDIFKDSNCKKCYYKYVCLGGCPLSSRTKNQDISCGVFANEEILDNIEINHKWIFRGTLNEIK